jgi:hypothetical protein
MMVRKNRMIWPAWPVIARDRVSEPGRLLGRGDGQARRLPVCGRARRAIRIRDLTGQAPSSFTRSGEVRTLEAAG